MNTSQRYQLWPQMWLCLSIGFLSLLAVLLPNSWAEDAHHLYQFGFDWPIALELGLPALVSLLISGAFTYWLLYVPGGRAPVTHLSGSVRLSGRKAKRHAKRACTKATKKDDMGKGLFLHPHVQLPVRQELANILVYGQQGAGKSVILKPIVEQIRQRGDRLFIYDRKNEYTPLFFDDRSILISPTDARGIQWDLAQDVTNEQEATLVAHALISETQDPLWSNGARLILTGLMMILINQKRPCTWYSLAGLLDMSHKELQGMLADSYPLSMQFVQENSKTTQSFFVTLISQLKWLKLLSKHWRPGAEHTFSIKQWFADDSLPKTFIVAHDEANESLSAPLCNALFSLMVSHVLAMSDSDSRRIWFALDELSSLPKTPALEKWLRLARSKGGRSIAGLQALSQLRSVYDRDTAETILALFGNVIALRMGASGEAAEHAAKSFGEHQVERRVTTITESGQYSTTCQYLSEPLVRPDELVNLKHSWRGIQGFVMVSGWEAVYQLRFPFPQLPAIAEPFERAAPLSPATPKQAMCSDKPNRLRRQAS
ncbi:type IV secretion system DNA-binding domain-containing protein [Alteromonas sp.]|uniref:type IV secretion system DNA-binding domain-containing protein n=1 Tax=Alteromonas sp. TaxID=232 RepID=UPI0035122303